MEYFQRTAQEERGRKLGERLEKRSHISLQRLIDHDDSDLNWLSHFFNSYTHPN